MLVGWCGEQRRRASAWAQSEGVDAVLGIEGEEETTLHFSRSEDEREAPGSALWGGGRCLRDGAGDCTDRGHHGTGIQGTVPREPDGTRRSAPSQRRGAGSGTAGRKHSTVVRPCRAGGRFAGTGRGRMQGGEHV
ncbi:hypothetical protein TRVL_08339 [Trypanosoma vivax]|nr:hypothetical protein TRVL_08339 [Trypanosoma vivax]